VKNDIRRYNRAAWDREAERGSLWTTPVEPEVIERARRGEWQIILTPTRFTPPSWFPPIEGLDVLCLASGGGQQGPVLAAAGANVTVLDNSPRQLESDRFVARRDRLEIETVEGDMADLSMFPSESFDLIVHPCSNLFIPDVLPVWREAYRVLRPGGSLLAGFLNPIQFLFDQERDAKKGELAVRFPIPYATMSSLTEEEAREHIERGDALEFGHTLEDLIGGQIDAGFLIAGFYEDRWPEENISEFIATFMATRAVKPESHQPASL
jgi:SAM-dependent methyltransferase